MTTLTCAHKPACNVVNITALAACASVRDALIELDLAGCTAIDMTWRGGRPVLRIDRAPPGVRGVQTVRSRAVRCVERVYAALYRGVQLEWIAHDDAVRVRGAVRADQAGGRP